MANPRQMGLFDGHHPKSAHISIKAKHELVQLTDLTPWPDLIAHYAPARYLCNLMDSTWNPDHITIFEFTQMMGPEGMDIFNNTFLSKAEELGTLGISRVVDFRLPILVFLGT